MIYWQTKCDIIQYQIPKGSLLTQPQMRKYKFDMNNITFFNKICVNKNDTEIIDNFRRLKPNAKYVEVPRIITFESEKK